jgi:hypothetical protein
LVRLPQLCGKWIERYRRPVGQRLQWAMLQSARQFEPATRGTSIGDRKTAKRRPERKHENSAKDQQKGAMHQARQPCQETGEGQNEKKDEHGKGRPAGWP